jgi:hypothetical protein
MDGPRGRCRRHSELNTWVFRKWVRVRLSAWSSNTITVSTFAKTTMTSRFKTVPEDFLNHLKSTIPGFDLETERHQFAMARMAWIGRTKSNQHVHVDHDMSFTHEYLEEEFGRAKFDTVNARLKLFRVSSNWSKRNRYTKGYSFSAVLRDGVSEYLTASPWTSTTRLMTAPRRAVKTVPPAVASKDKSGVTTSAWTAAKKLNVAKVDLKALATLKSELLAGCVDLIKIEAAGEPDDDSPRGDVERAIETIDKVCRLAMTEGPGEGYMAHHYEESDSGRLYPTGISLASAQTVVKDAALTGCWEYDISNCHYAILAQMSARFGHTCADIDDYIKNKAVIRETIAKQAGVSLRKAKICLVALMYGARSSTWHENAIPLEIGEEAAKKLYATPLFKGLSGDIAKARTAVILRSPKTRVGSIVNAFGKSIAGTASQLQKMAHLLQGVEAKALQAVVNRYPDDIVLVQHDGFVSTARLDVNALSDAIFAGTGYRLELEERLLAADADKYFSSRI